uniref:Uncharacterized protein n=1 Tax=Anguilla anguilla TaxID=7936 RepID=A0A0E9PQ94_ANGAN
MCTLCLDCKVCYNLWTLPCGRNPVHTLLHMSHVPGAAHVNLQETGQ